MAPNKQTLANATINASLRDERIQGLVKDGYSLKQSTDIVDNLSKQISEKDLSTLTRDSLVYEGVLDKNGDFVDTPENREKLDEAIVKEQRVKNEMLKKFDEKRYSVAADPATGDMYKVPHEDLNIKEEVEFKSPTGRAPVLSRPFFIKLVDSDFVPHGIVVLNKHAEAIITDIKLTPNPSSLTINSSKIINRYHTMTRWVEEHWGDEIDVISFSGNTYSFFGYSGNGIPSENTGLTTQYRNKTEPYKMLQALATFFNYNGVIYQDNVTYEGTGTAHNDFLNDEGNSYFFSRHPRTGMIKERLYIKLIFDFVSVIGYFETFDIIEEAGKPFLMTYNVVFKAEQTEYQMEG